MKSKPEMLLRKKVHDFQRKLGLGEISQIATQVTVLEILRFYSCKLKRSIDV